MRSLIWVELVSTRTSNFSHLLWRAAWPARRVSILVDMDIRVVRTKSSKDFEAGPEGSVVSVSAAAATLAHVERFRPWARGVHHAPPHIPTKLCFSEPSECPQ